MVYIYICFTDSELSQVFAKKDIVHTDKKDGKPVSKLRTQVHKSVIQNALNAEIKLIQEWLQTHNLFWPNYKEGLTTK